MSRRRVVITGLGPVTAFGVGIEPLWEAMIAGRSGIGRITRFDPSGFDCQIAAELPVDEIKIRDYIPKSHRKAAKVMCRDIELAVAGAHAAITDASLVTRGTDPKSEPTIAPDRFGCQIGAGLISADVDELTAALWSSRSDDNTIDLNHWGSAGMQNMTPLWLLKYLPNMLACHVTIVHDCQGPSNTITCCEASSALSLGESMRVIQRGAADACLTGGAEYKLNLMAYFRQQCTGRLAMHNGNGDTTTVVRPFDPNATGTVLGEGGGLLVVEALETAKVREADPIAEVVGFASTQSYCPDATGLEIDAQGQSIVDAIEIALNHASIDPSEIDAIVPFGSGIPHVDDAEASAMQSVFGDRTTSIPLITTVPFTGNCCAGFGGVSLSVAAKCLNEQMLPARLNTTDAEGLDANACPSRQAELNHILVLSVSQGGQNATVILKKYNGSD